MEVIVLAVLSKMEGINILGNCLIVHGGRRDMEWKIQNSKRAQ